MRDSSVTQNARHWLEHQLTELGGLFNAGARSPVFKQWRQATLTVIQRIWAGQAAKSDRFRRIPFSPPTTAADERETRVFFEKGCGEAGTVLREMIAEIDETGVPPEADARAIASAPGNPAGEFPTLDLDNENPGSPPPRTHSASFRSSLGSASSAPRTAKPQRRGGKQQLKDLLGLSENPAAHEAPEAAAGPPPAPPLGAPRPPVPQESSGAARIMSDLAPPEFQVPTEPSSRTRIVPVPPPPPRQAPARPQRFPLPPDAAFPGPPEFELPESAIDPLTPAGNAAEPENAAAGQATLEEVTEELLSGYAHAGESPESAHRGRAAMPLEPRSGVASAVVALASEVDSLGVPDGLRARARAMLLDLSRELDSPDLSWETLRLAVSFVMEFPALGRRVLPLLLTYLDRAA